MGDDLKCTVHTKICQKVLFQRVDCLRWLKSTIFEKFPMERSSDVKEKTFHKALILAWFRGIHREYFKFFIYALFLKFRAPGMFPPPPTYGEYSPNPKLLFSHFSASAENGGTFDGWLGYDCNSCIFNECRNFLCYGCLLLLFRFLSICSRRR